MSTAKVDFECRVCTKDVSDEISLLQNVPKYPSNLCKKRKNRAIYSSNNVKSSSEFLRLIVLWFCERWKVRLVAWLLAYPGLTGFRKLTLLEVFQKYLTNPKIFYYLVKEIQLWNHPYEDNIPMDRQSREQTVSNPLYFIPRWHRSFHPGLLYFYLGTYFNHERNCGSIFDPPPLNAKWRHWY